MEHPPRPTSAYKPSVSHLREGVFADHSGRSFFTARDLGIAEATNGDFTARVVHAKPGEPATTGWHYHDGNLQIVYCVRGWEDLAFEDGTSVRLEPGSCINIPPGFGHCETGYSEDFEVVVITNPAQLATFPMNPPDVVGF